MIFLTPAQRRALEGLTPELADRRDAREAEAQRIVTLRQEADRQRALDIAKYAEEHPEPYTGYDEDSE